MADGCAVVEVDEFALYDFERNAGSFLERIVSHVLCSAFDAGNFDFGQFGELINEVVNLAFASCA